MLNYAFFLLRSKCAMVVYCAVLASSHLWAQGYSTSMDDDDETDRVAQRALRDAIYDTFLPVYTQHVGTIGIYTNGWGFMYEYGWGKQKKKKFLTSLEFSVLKDGKERSNSFRVTFNNRSRVVSYIYAKQNIMYPIKLSFGQQWTFGLPNAFRGVQVDVFYKGSLILGIMRPYYLTVRTDNGQTDAEGNSVVRFENIKYSPQDSLLFLEPTRILEYTGFSSGWNEVKIIPGFSANIGGRFNFAPAVKSRNIVGVEVALSADFYTQSVPLLVPRVNTVARNFFLQGRFSFYFGGYSKHPSKDRIAILP